VVDHLTFRQIESVEIDEMLPEALDAFTSVNPCTASRLNLGFLSATAACNPEPQPVSYVLCRIEDDLSLTLVKAFKDSVSGMCSTSPRYKLCNEGHERG